MSGHHPVFARIYARMASEFEAKGCCRAPGRAARRALRARHRSRCRDGPELHALPARCYLPSEDAAFDAGVASPVLCSVPQPACALAELFRVIRPGGELRFYERVLAENARWARRQRRMSPVWRRFGGGCHPDRDIGNAIAAAGFTVEQRRDLLFALNWIAKLTAPHILGRARRP